VLPFRDDTLEVLTAHRVEQGAQAAFQTLLDYLEAGQPLAEFLDDFPAVRAEAVAALEQAKEALLARARP
jgi:uncharacterized protein (DUF433 family)